MKWTRQPARSGIMLLCLIIIFIIGGMVAYHFLEQLGWLDALLFAVVTATSVGYGNLAPHTAGGKIFTIFYIFTSIVFVFSFVNHFSRRTRKANLFRRFFSAIDPDSK